VKHTYVNPKADGGDATITRPSNWNAVHQFGRTALSANTTLDDTHDLVEVTCGAADKTITLPTAVGRDGRPYRIMKKDTGAGNVQIQTTSSQTVPTLPPPVTLSTRRQWIEVYSDGANWEISSSGST
jgi:hypothetical protein